VPAHVAIPACRGQSFHFAPRYKLEGFHESILRHEHYLAGHLNVGPGDKVIDLGCGVGGPLRNIARFTYANVTGINNNA
jgi:sterol 24-C-methyltransferase